MQLFDVVAASVQRGTLVSNPGGTADYRFELSGSANGALIEIEKE
ncbi:hypothetical protein ACYOEI_13610 [Singulisphaera rosea]